ncbi:TetR/AcrR family transcriptional regulator [Mariniluteicoccus flavus]
MTTLPEGRAPRRDAQRNRARIVEAAERAYAAEGLEVALDAIAKQAGVGAGTLYRHFPTRSDLVAAVLESRRPDLERERGAIIAAGLDPVEALDRWLDALAAWMRAYDGLPEPLRAAADADTPLGASCDEVIGATEDFLRPVREQGRARASVDGRDLFLGVLAVTWAAASSAAGPRGPVAERLRALLRDGWAVD